MVVRAGVESSEKKMRVVIVEIVEEDDKGRRSVKRIDGRQAEAFVRAAEETGIKVKWQHKF